MGLGCCHNVMLNVYLFYESCLVVLFLMSCPDVFVLSVMLVNGTAWMQDKFQTCSDNKVLSYRNRILLQVIRLQVPGGKSTSGLVCLTIRHRDLVHNALKLRQHDHRSTLAYFGRGFTVAFLMRWKKGWLSPP